MNKQQYTAYLTSERWQITKDKALKRAGNRCSVCASTKDLNVHHNTYDRLGRESNADLIVLCRQCHALFHNVRGIVDVLSYNSTSTAQPKIEGGFVILPKNTIKCNQYKKLSPHTRVVYQAVLTAFIRDNDLNPDNHVTITHDQIEEIAGIGHSSVVRAIQILKQAGFLRVVIAGGWQRGPATFQLNKRYVETGNLNSYW